MKILMQNPNFLILDEPTNDLDIDTLNVLEEFLENFPGVLILVSHDRYLLDKMSEQLFIMEGTGAVTIYNGNYSEYRMSLEHAKEKVEVKKKEVKAITPVPFKKLGYKEQKELEGLELQIPALEAEIKGLTDSLIKIEAANYSEIQKVTEKINQLQSDLDLATERWMELSEK